MNIAFAGFRHGHIFGLYNMVQNNDKVNLIGCFEENPDAKKEQKVLYGIATKRTELRTFPAPVAIWDDPADSDFDYQYLVSVRVNEPVVITSKSKDGNYYLAKSICCSGWIPKDSVAICKDKDEWISAWDIKNENVLVVWGDKVFTETSIVGAETSDLMLTMGTVLELAKDVNPNELIDNRAAYNNYAVWVPVRNDDGTYSKKLTLISEHKKVYAGYMPLTKENISKVVFSALGNTYGWGGSLNSDDCSGYMRNVYKCFGMELARNTTWQSSMPMAKVNMQYMPKEEKIKFFDALPFGTILYFSGHEMMYLGCQNGKYYVISAVGTIMQPENPSVRQRIRSTIVNTLDVKRANGNTWFDELTVALVPYFSVNENTLPEYEWYHDGVAYCLKNKIMQGDENKFFNPSKNITWAEFLQILYNMEETKPENELEEKLAKYPQFKEKLYEYISLYGDRSPEELKMETITFRESPLLLIKKISELSSDEAIFERTKSSLLNEAEISAKDIAIGIKKRKKNKM